MVEAVVSMKNNKRVVTGWAFFDWANSAYALVISAAIFPGYYTANTDAIVDIAGWKVSNSSLYSYAIAVAYLMIAVSSPALSGIADYGGIRKKFMRFFTVLGASACIALFWFKGMDTLWVGLLGFIFATAGFAGGLVFYNSYLPVIASADQYDKVSAKGFIYGYVGSIILLVINLVIILNPSWFGLPEGASGAKFAAQIAFVMVGLWWIGFSQIPFKRLPADRDSGETTEVLIHKGWLEIKNVWTEIKATSSLRFFLYSFLLYNAGVQTVLFMASIFAAKVLNFETSELILLILILQLVAALGANIFAKVSEIRGNKFALNFMLCCWVVICIGAYVITDKTSFYLLASLVGLVMGGIQSLSRSTYAKLIPEGAYNTTSYFSFMDVMDKISVVVGTFAFGFVEQITGSIRNSALSLSVFFIVGMFLLTKVQLVRNRPVA